MRVDQLGYVAGNRFSGLDAKASGRPDLIAQLVDTGVDAVTRFEVCLLNLLAVDVGAVQAAEIVHKNRATRQNGNSGMVAGNAGMIENQIVDFRSPNGNGRGG